MPAPRHIHLTCMLRMAEMTVVVFYRVTMDKVVRAPRIAHLLTVTWVGGQVGAESAWTLRVMLFTLPGVSGRDSSKRSALESR